MQDIPLYENWDLKLFGTNISITPLLPEDEKPYAQLMLGSFYDQALTRLGHIPDTDFAEAIAHESGNEVHALRPIGSNKFIGWITLQHDDDRPDIGISLIDEYQNKGFGPEAIRLYGNWLNKEYGLTEMYVRISEDNPQSQRAFCKVGAVKYRSAKNNLIESIASMLPDDYSDTITCPNTDYYRIHLPIK